MLPMAQVPSNRGTELATLRADGTVGHKDGALGLEVLDIPEAACESMIEPHDVTDDPGREAVPPVQGFRRSVAVRQRQLSSTVPLYAPVIA